MSDHARKMTTTKNLVRKGVLIGDSRVRAKIITQEEAL